MADQFNILDYTIAPTLKSGQTVDRTPAGRTTKDDGGFQRGISGSKADAQYLIYTLGQYAGTTVVTVNAINDSHTNACVLDKVTGLMWNREQTPLLYGTGAEGLRWDDTAGSDEDIFEYCDQANIAALSGFTDWRVPNIMELFSLSILNVALAAPKINAVAFPVWPTGHSYSSTTSANSLALAVTMSFTSGATSTQNKTGTRHSAPLVRLGIE